MLTPVIFVIIPVYNAKKYLRYSLDRLMNQTFRDFEVLLVDDDSKDDSLEICQSYSKEDDRFITIHKDNGGVSSARNVGIENAKGKYIAFCDCDDWYKKDGLKLLLDAISNNNVDVSCGSVLKIWPHVNNIEYFGNRILNKKLNQNDYDFFHNIGSGVWGKLFKNSIIKDNNIKFRAVNREDSIFFYDYLQCCNSIACINDIVYEYNKLEITTGCHSFNPKYNYWCYKNYETRLLAYQDWIDDKDVVCAYKKDLVSYYIIDCVSNYLSKDNDQSLIAQLIEETIEYYKDEIYIENVQKESLRVLGFDISSLIENKQFSEIYNLYNRKKDNYFIDLTKNVIKYIGYKIKENKYAR